MVVIHHANIRANHTYSVSVDLSFGAAGVDIFFVISGFIMLYITRGKSITPIEFFLRRLARIAPTYWLLTITATILLAYYPFLFSGHGTWSIFIKSMLFIPTEAMPPATFGVPVIAVGWTLNMEILFYGMLAVSLLAGRNYVFVVCVMVVSLCCFSYGLHNSTRSGIGMYAFQNGVMLEFLLGMSLAFFLPRSEEIKPAIGIMVSALGFALLVHNWPVQNGTRLLSTGFPAMLIVGGFLISEPIWRGFAMSRRLRILGDASYSIYLTHLFVIYPIYQVARRNKEILFAYVPFWLFMAGLVLAATAIGVLFHLVIEKPIGRWTHHLLRPHRTRPYHQYAPSLAQPA